MNYIFSTITAVFLGFMAAKETGPWIGLIIAYMVLHIHINTIMLLQPIHIHMHEIEIEEESIDDDPTHLE